MTFDLALAAMNAAVAAVTSSPHPENKVAACVFDDSGARFTATNHWPKRIADKLGTDARIGGASGTVHAETAALLGFPAATKGAGIAITDPFCPNCAKNMAEAGIARIYIDSKGFEKDFFLRRRGHFETLSMQVCEAAGIEVFKLNRKERLCEDVLRIAAGYVPPNESPPEIAALDGEADEAAFQALIAGALARHGGRKFCAALALDARGNAYSICVRAHPAIGYALSGPDQVDEALRAHGKYSLIQEPVNRMLMVARRKGLRLKPGYLFASAVPTAREQVNLAGAGMTRVTVGDLRKSRDAGGLDAMRVLSEAGILRFD